MKYFKIITQQNINMGYRNSFTVLLIFVCFGLYAQTGIGTTTPVNKFQVETTVADPLTSGSSRNGHLRLSGVGLTHAVDVGLMSTTSNFGSWIQTRKTNDYSINYNLLLNPNGGSVGIGTVSPTTTLTVGNAAGTIPGEISLNPTSPTAGEGGQITLKKSLQGGTDDWTIDQVGTSSANARLRIFRGSSETSGLAILENGNTGIGTIAPSVRLQVNGDIIANSIAGSSDLRFKTNIIPIVNPLQKVLALRGVNFKWNTSAFPQRMFSDHRALGFIAQEVEKVLPEVVQTENTKEGFKSVQYDKVVALLVEAIKEQQKQINQLKKEVKKLRRTR